MTLVIIRKSAVQTGEKVVNLGESVKKLRKKVVFTTGCVFEFMDGLRDSDAENLLPCEPSA